MLRTIQSTPTALGIARGKVALTFDDGPVPGGLTDALLDLLAAEQITAGFCLVGRRIPGNEAIVERIHAEGHLIVNHGDAHISPGRLSEDGFRQDLQSFDERVAKALQLLGWKSDYFRPAGGLRSRRLLELLDDCEKTLMPMTYFAWDVVPFPYFQRLICGGLKMNLRFRNAG
ncbi:MAG: polysaccharide deacetylase family protein, partial [Verrucomicrobiota bacterium]